MHEKIALFITITIVFSLSLSTAKSLPSAFIKDAQHLCLLTQQEQGMQTICIPQRGSITRILNETASENKLIFSYICKNARQEETLNPIKRYFAWLATTLETRPEMLEMPNPSSTDLYYFLHGTHSKAPIEESYQELSEAFNGALRQQEIKALFDEEKWTTTPIFHQTTTNTQPIVSPLLIPRWLLVGPIPFLLQFYRQLRTT